MVPEEGGAAAREEEIMRYIVALLLCAAVAWTGLNYVGASNYGGGDGERGGGGEMSDQKERFERATFAGGCFWCMEPPFEKLDGVHEVVSGYTGGGEKDPTYEEVASGATGHYEAVQILFDPAVVSYEELLAVFWRQIDPTDDGGSFVDRGGQYRSAVFYHSAGQKAAAERSKSAVDESGRFDKPVATGIVEYAAFYRAEEYHQDYYKKNPVRYKVYRYHSGRDRFITEAWEERKVALDDGYQKPSEEDLRTLLTPIQFEVTQQDGTERAFQNDYWDNKEEGIYVDIVSGEPLFSSLDKYDSKSGWPSFSRPLDPDAIVEKSDRKLFMVRTEVRSRKAGSHLGHVFDDGPAPTGKRYCINSAALRFVPRERLESEGYGELSTLFEGRK